MTDQEARDLIEQQSHINQMQADLIRKMQEVRYQPWLAAFAGMTAGAALFAAGIAFTKLFGA